MELYYLSIGGIIGADGAESNSRPSAYKEAALPLSYAGISGGPDRDRTDDIPLAGRMLSHLSYRPFYSFVAGFYSSGRASAVASMA